MKQEIKAYSCTMIETDSSIDLHQDPKNVENNGNRLGLCLASALKKLGLVDQSV